MHEVEKMYKTIFGEFAPNCSLCVKLVECEIINNTHNCNKFQCDYQRLFTAEKQLSLIKWLGELDMLEIMRTTREDKAWIINSEYGMSGNVYKHTSRMKSFEETLAGLINSLWQDLTEEERKQVKGILE